MPRHPALAVVVFLAATPARAEGFCELFSENGKPSIVSDFEQKKTSCTKERCVGTYAMNALSGHVARCLYVADAQDVPTDTVELGVDIGRVGARLLPDGTVEAHVMGREVVRRERYRVEGGKLVRMRSEPEPRPPPEPSPPRVSCSLASLREDAKASSDEEPACTGTPAPEQVLQRAREACKAAPEARGVSGCEKGHCLLAVDTGCAALSRPGKPLLALLLPGAQGLVTLSLQQDEALCFRDSGDCKNIECGYALCADLRGKVPLLKRPAVLPELRQDGAQDVPPFAGELKVDGRATEPGWRGGTVWADTLVHVAEGIEAWSGPEDGSAEWVFRWRGDTLVFLVRVHDDTVVTQGEGDALGFGEPEAPRLRLALLPGGRVRASGPGGSASQASCAWAGVPGGYRMECIVPDKELRLLPAPSRDALQPQVLDRDKGGATTRIEAQVRITRWTAYPPSWEEALRVTEP